MLVCEIREGKRIFYDRPVHSAWRWGTARGISYDAPGLFISAPEKVRADTPITFELEGRRYRGPLLIEGYDPESGEIQSLNPGQVAALAPKDAVERGEATLEMGYDNDPIFVPSFDEFRAWSAMGALNTSGYWVWTRDGHVPGICDAGEVMAMEAVSNTNATYQTQTLLDWPQTAHWPCYHTSGGIFTVIDMTKAPEVAAALQSLQSNYMDLGYGPTIELPEDIMINNGVATHWTLFNKRWLYSASHILGPFAASGTEYENSELRKQLLDVIYPAVLQGLHVLGGQHG